MPDGPADAAPPAPDESDAPRDEAEAAGSPGADGDGDVVARDPADKVEADPSVPAHDERAGDADDVADEEQVEGAADSGESADAGDEAGPVWGPPAPPRSDLEPVFDDAEPPFATKDATEDATDSPVDDTERDDGPLPLSRGTPLRLPAVRARRPGVLAAVLRACWEELNYPRARARAGLRRAANRMKERRLVAALLWGTLAGITFILYASGVGVTRGGVAWAVFVGVALGLAAGGPAMLVHAWPAAVTAPLVACAWAGWAFGPGALWLGLATCAGLLVLYFAAAEAAPLVGAAGVSWMAMQLLGSAEGGTRMAVAGAAFVASAAVLIVLRKHVTAPIAAACWVVLSGIAAARVAWWTLGQAIPTAWAVQVLPGPRGLAACVAGAAFGAALFCWPRRRETMTQAILAAWRPRLDAARRRG